MPRGDTLAPALRGLANAMNASGSLITSYPARSFSLRKAEEEVRQHCAVLVRVGWR